MTPVIYHEAAEDELIEEIGYLEFQAEGLGQRFFREVQRVERLIAQFPQSAEEIRPGIRKRVLHFQAILPNCAWSMILTGKEAF